MVHSIILLIGKTDSSRETKKKRNRRGHTQVLGNCAWLSGRMHIEERRTKNDCNVQGPRLYNGTKQNKERINVTPGKGNVASASKNARRIQARAACG